MGQSTTKLAVKSQQIAKAVNVQVISLKDAPNGYKDFDKGVAKKFVIDPHGMIMN